MMNCIEEYSKTNKEIEYVNDIRLTNVDNPTVNIFTKEFDSRYSNIINDVKWGIQLFMFIYTQNLFTHIFICHTIY